MKNIGIICEYNPFHHGHARQLRLVKEQGTAVCLMSGYYVQRGEPAVIGKSVRAEAAVLGGADLVLELPVTYALRSAEGFADGGVEIFRRLGLIDSLSFGSECGDTEKLLSLAEILDTDDFSQMLRAKLDEGLSFPAARQKALEALGQPGELLANPNDILAVEYCKAILRRGGKINPLVIQRNGSYHHGTDPDAPSASVLRGLEDWAGYMPEESYALQSSAVRHSLAAGERAVLSRLRALSDPEFEALPFGSEGLWRKLMQACRRENSVSEILCATKSKRYTLTRLMRMLLCAFLGISREEMEREVPYIRVLAMNRRGGKLLRQLREQSDLLLLNGNENAPDCSYRDLERRADALYGLFAQGETEGPLRPESLRYRGDLD